VTASSDRTARLWDAETGAEVAVLKGHGESVRIARFGLDGRRIVTETQEGSRRSVWLWDNTAIWTRETGVIPAALAGLLLAVKAPGAHMVAFGCSSQQGPPPPDQE
jgi:hypothetical protein